MNADQQRWNSAYTGRSARTMQGAFGPYVDHKLDPIPETGYSAAWWAVFAIVAVLALIVIFANR